MTQDAAPSPAALTPEAARIDVTKRQARNTNDPTRLGHGTQDGRSRRSRRFRDVSRRLIDELPADPPESAITLARRAASVVIMLEDAETALAGGQTVDLTAYASAAGLLKRLLDSLALHRATSLPPDLAALMGGLPSTAEEADE